MPLSELNDLKLSVLSYTMKIPSQAKLVFKGVIFDVYQWEQKMYDGSTAIFEAIKRTGTVQVIPTVGDKVLLSFEEQPGKPRQITFFGGRMEEGEKPLEAAKRELLEETGLQSDDWELFREYSSVGKIIWPMFFYIARNCHKVTQPHLDSGEKIEIKEFSFVEFVDIVSQENFADSHISNEVFRLKQDPQKLEEFRQKLFPR